MRICNTQTIQLVIEIQNADHLVDRIVSDHGGVQFRCEDGQVYTARELSPNEHVKRRHICTDIMN